MNGQELYKRAKKVIPGGTMLLSKRPEMFLPEIWPSYFSKALGCEIWDLNGNKYIDCSIMGVGTNTLGYGNPEVDNAVKNTITSGNMSTFNCPEEVYLAEKLIEINPWADMVRFARTGGEANSIAIRIARAASGKDNIAICGYHGWHDWYLSVNHNTYGDNLKNHLIPGLEPNGVPLNLKNTVFPFDYNNFDQLLKIVENYKIGVIKMEVLRNQYPTDNFLKKVRDLATKKGIVLIFDECTSGFRETFGGINKKFQVYPDITIFGKTLGNGYAITAVVGKREIMEHAQNTFISSTFWTERIGPTAALKTLEVMEKTKSWQIITDKGIKIQKGLRDLAKNNNVKIKIFGLPSLTGFEFQSKNHQKYKTLITQEMLKRKILAGNLFYPSIKHSNKILNTYLSELEEIFNQIANCENGNSNIDELLKSEISHMGFKRLN
jgi:glutamate-1-semialdehyde aminotransferase